VSVGLFSEDNISKLPHIANEVKSLGWAVTVCRAWCWNNADVYPFTLSNLRAPWLWCITVMTWCDVYHGDYGVSPWLLWCDVICITVITVVWCDVYYRNYDMSPWCGVMCIAVIVTYHCDVLWCVSPWLGCITMITGTWYDVMYITLMVIYQHNVMCCDAHDRACDVPPWL